MAGPFGSRAVRQENTAPWRGQSRVGIVLQAILGILGALATAAHGQQVLWNWEFNRHGDLEGWRANSHSAQTRVADGVLTTTVVDWDPILVHDVLPEPFRATPTQVVEVRIKSPVADVAELFWTGTTEGRYGGFAAEKRTPFTLRPGWQTYRVRPFWQGEGRIVKLRLDLPGVKRGEEAQQTYQIDWIRIIELGPSGPPVAADWDFADGTQGWRVDGEGALRTEDGWLVASLRPAARLIAPPVDVDAYRDVFISFQMAVETAGGREGLARGGRLFWAAAKRSGLGQLDLEVLCDGQPHVYNIPVSVESHWRGRVISLALEPLVGQGCTVRLDWFRCVPRPTGPPELEVKRFFLSDPLPRAGRPAELILQLANRGSDLARPLKIDLEVPNGVRLAEEELASRTVAGVDFHEPRTLTWRVVATRPGPATFRVRMSGPKSLEASATDTFLAAIRPLQADYVPEPRPVRGKFDVGVYYFPGWATWDRWQRIQPFPERKPVLGWYREGSPEVADWHIKWAVEHGITFFCYDWYWHQGQTRLTHALEDGLFHARYRRLLKFCLLWANHAPTRHTEEDNRKVCQFWIENYFRRPEYYKVDGRPLVVIFSVWAMKRDLGIDGTREAIELWHRMTREAGVGEVLVAGCGRPGQVLDEMKRMGFDAVTGYNWPKCGVGDRNFVPYVEVARRQFDQWWTPMAEAASMPVLVPTSPGWDSRPWHGRRAFVQTDRTPKAFEEHLRLAKRFVEETNQPRVVLIEAWNEFGEGSYCEPHKEFGFGHLDAVRRVFCPDAAGHVDLAPADVGLGPYDVGRPPMSRDAWEFNTDGDAEGWTASMGLADVTVAGGSLQARTTGRDPAFSCPVRLPARLYRTVELRMAVTGARPGDSAQLFWSTRLTATSEPASVRFPLAADGRMHNYRLKVGENSLWRGTITGLRLDPCSTENAQVAIDWVRLNP